MRVDLYSLDIAAGERDFYGDGLILLEGVISEFLSCLAMIRRYQVSRGKRDPVASVQARVKSAERSPPPTCPCKPSGS